MNLSDLLTYDNIVIQCHDNPDADAIASGYALWWYFDKHGKETRFIYRGERSIRKSNLCLMIKELEIPISYQPEFSEVPDLLVTVDCQYGQKNVTETPAKTVAVIDHHFVADPLPPLSEVRSNLGSCGTILWDLIRKEGLDVSEDKKLATALYYGLFTDTNSLSEVSHPLDRDMIDSLVINRSTIMQLRSSNISLEELKITGSAISHYDYHGDYRYVILRAKHCDPNILGVIGDFTLETDSIDVSLAYTINPTEIKFSVRSCVKEVRANELASILSEDIGGGGGHPNKAGGTINPELLDNILYDKLGKHLPTSEEELDPILNSFFQDRLQQYFDSYEIVYAQKSTLSREGAKKYRKLSQELGYVHTTVLFPEKTPIEVRTLEGDVDITCHDKTYIMIGIEGEIYPITEEKLFNSYNTTEKPLLRNFEYAPSVTNNHTGEKKPLMEHAKCCYSTGESRIYAKPLTRKMKLFTLWDEEKYYSGNPGDYLAFREDDAHDIYIIKGRLFHQLYEEVTD